VGHTRLRLDAIKPGGLRPHILGQKPKNQVAILSKQRILATVAPVSVGLAQMLAAIQFDGEEWHRHSWLCTARSGCATWVDIHEQA
jgi:hypothetical protein